MKKQYVRLKRIHNKIPKNMKKSKNNKKYRRGAYR
jgi:hypothetical protein